MALHRSRRLVMNLMDSDPRFDDVLRHASTLSPVRCSACRRCAIRT
jgi:hypothetical protein